MRRTLVTGATGFVGHAVLGALVRAEVATRCLVRDAGRLAVPLGPAGHADVEVIEADLADRATLDLALADVDVAYYLVHSMEAGRGGFAARDRVAAQHFAATARAASVERLVYLGGVLPAADQDGTAAAISAHLASRLEVEQILADAAPAFVSVRASMVVGTGSASFGALVDLVERLPVLALPAWRHRRTTPIGLADVVTCLLAARDVAPGVYTVGGPDTLSLEEIVREVASVLGRRRRVVGLPVTVPALEGAIAAVLSGGDRATLAPLMASLDRDLVVEGDDVRRVFGVTPASFAAAARAALDPPAAT